jgi:4-amino-4-deoxy-L-arabinose transferase-like glycosyltransferase
MFHSPVSSSLEISSESQIRSSHQESIAVHKRFPLIYSFTVLLISFVSFCFISWHRWASVVIDGGREMNLPWRLLNGETLYSEAYYLYGPLAPYVNALLYKIFGVHLNTLYAAGFICSLLILLLVFQIGRRIMPLLQATLATLAVMVICVFKQGGHTPFPYAFSALYGITLALGAFAAQFYFLENRKNILLLISGFLIGLTLICKQEYALAAIAGSFALILLPSKNRFGIALRIFLPAIAIPIITYGILALKIPASALFDDTFFLPNQVPRELVYFNMSRIGMDYPSKTIFELLQSTSILMWVGGLIALVSIFCAHKIDRTSLRSMRYFFLVTLIGLIAFFLIHWLSGIDWWISPMRALPLLCAMVIFGSLLDLLRKKSIDQYLFLIAVFSLVVLTREITRVSSGGAYTAFMLPLPLVLFTYLTTVSFPNFLSTNKMKHYARVLALGMFMLVLGSTAKHIIKVYLTEPSYDVNTMRGSVRTKADVGPAFDQALSFISKNTGPSDFIFAAPEGSSLNFLANRPTALRYEQLIPGFVDEAQQEQAIQRLKERKVKFIFILNRPTREFGPVVFGQDYGVHLMNWIEDHYQLTEVFGNNGSPASQIGDKNFFIKCYKAR